METGNPILERYVDRAPTQALTSGGTQSQTSKPPAAIRKLIAELGFRYRPSAAADLEAHAAAIALLAADLADVPPHLLQQAIRSWSLKSPYMPKAADLIGLCREISAPSRPKKEASEIWQRRALEGNRLAIHMGHHTVMHWKVSPAGFGTEIVHEPMPRDIHDRAMAEVDIAIFENLRRAG